MVKWFKSLLRRKKKKSNLKIASTKMIPISRTGHRTSKHLSYTVNKDKVETFDRIQ
jgi:hypothetical protein